MADTSNPRPMVNAGLLKKYLGRRVTTVMKVLRSDGADLVGQAPDGTSVTVHKASLNSSSGGAFSQFVEVVGIVEGENSLRAEICTNFGDSFGQSIHFPPRPLSGIFLCFGVQLSTLESRFFSVLLSIFWVVDFLEGFVMDWFYFIFPSSKNSLRLWWFSCVDSSVALLDLVDGGSWTTSFLSEEKFLLEIKLWNDLPTKKKLNTKTVKRESFKNSTLCLQLECNHHPHWTFLPREKCVWSSKVKNSWSEQLQEAKETAKISENENKNWMQKKWADIFVCQIH